MITELFRFDGDGWWPRIANDARKVCFGNEQSRVFDLTNGRVWSPFPARQSRWIHDDIVTCTVKIDDFRAKRFTRNALTIQEHTKDNPSLVAGNDFDADRGHWVSCIAAGRLVIDGRTIPGHFRNAQMKWPWVVATENDASIVWFAEGQKFAVAPLPARANSLRLQFDGTVTTGHFWDVQEISPGKAVFDITITPWKRESPHVITSDDRYWTSTETPDGQLGVIGAFVASKAIIIDGWGCSWLDAKWDQVNNRYIVAGCDDNGALRIYAVSADHTEISVSDWGISKPKPFGVRANEPKALGYFFGKRSKYGVFQPKENCAVLPLDAWQDSDGSHPPNVGEQLRASIRECGSAIISNTAIKHAAPEWKRVIGVFAGRQEGNVWVHEPPFKQEAQKLVAETYQQIFDAGLPPRPIIVILREEASTDSNFVGVGDALAPEIYFRTPETTYDAQLAVARQRIYTVCNALAPSPLYLCIQAFNRDQAPWKNNPDAIEAIQQAANEAITRSQVKGLLWFAYARPGGVRAYPQLEPWHVKQIEVTKPPTLIIDKEEPVPEIRTPNHAQAIDALRRIDDRYRNVLKRPRGMFGVPPDGKDVAITDPSRSDVEFDTKGLAVWGMSVYIGHFVRSTAGDPHEDAIRKTLAEIDNSDEAKANRPQ